MTESEILDAVRIDMGVPSVTEWPDSNLQINLKAALIEYSKYKPLRKIGVFTTEANVQEYDIASSYSYFTGFEEIYYSSSAFSVSADQTFYSSLAGVISNNNGLNTIDNESLRIIEQRQVQYIQSVGDYTWESLERGKVHLIPTPSSTGNVYFMYKERKQVSTLAEEEFKDIVDFTCVEALRGLGLKRHKVLQVNDPATGFVMFFGGRDFLKEAKEKEEKLVKKFGVGTIMRHG